MWKFPTHEEEVLAGVHPAADELRVAHPAEALHRLLHRPLVVPHVEEVLVHALHHKVVLPTTKYKRGL
jgi:hypothetical protein